MTQMRVGMDIHVLLVKLPRMCGAVAPLDSAHSHLICCHAHAIVFTCDLLVCRHAARLQAWEFEARAKVYAAECAVWVVCARAGNNHWQAQC